METDRKNIGIKAIEIYFPNQYIDQEELERHDNVSSGKYTIGLGQRYMGFCSDREDIYSISLTALSSLLHKYKIDPNSIGRLEVGTESTTDKSRSVKSVLMQLLAPSGNTNVEGSDTINACYGGTNALFNTVDWIESSAWDGRDGVVVAGDIAIYEKGAARPTGGVGCVAMLVGPNAPIVIEPGLRGSYSRHVYDFYKPCPQKEYPVINGKFSLECYTEALDSCYKAYAERENQLLGSDLASPSDQGQVPLDRFDYMLFHSPLGKVVKKAYARLLYNDYKDDPQNPLFSEISSQLPDVSYDESLKNDDITRLFMQLSENRFTQRVLPSLDVSSMCGNMYTGSVYGCLASLISNIKFNEARPKRIGIYSYGSGLIASMFSFKIVGDVFDLAAKLNLKARFDARYAIPVGRYEEICQLREHAYMRKDYVPLASTEHLVPGTYYLTKVSESFEREYAVKE